MVEVGEDVVGPLVQRPAELAQLDECLGDAGGKDVDQLGDQPLALGRVLGPIGGDQGLVDRPGDLYLGVAVVDEEPVETIMLRLRVTWGEPVFSVIRMMAQGRRRVWLVAAKLVTLVKPWATRRKNWSLLLVPSRRPLLIRRALGW